MFAASPSPSGRLNHSGAVSISTQQFTAEIPRDILDQLPLRIYVKDLLGRFTYMNQACAADLGIDSPQIGLGKSDFDFFDAGLAVAWRQEEEQIARSGEPVVEKDEIEQWQDEKRPTYVETSKFAYRDGTGEVVGILGISKDITKQIDLLDAIPSLVYVKVLDSRTGQFVFQFVNQAVAVGFGRTKSEILGRSDADMLGAGPEADGFRRIDERVFKTGESEIVREEVFSHAGLGRRLLATVKVALRVGDGATSKIVGVLGISTDITELRQAERELAEQQELFRNLLEHIPSGIFFKDVGGRFIQVNRALAKFLSGTEDTSAILGKSDRDYFPPDYCAESANEEAAIFASGSPALSVRRRTVMRGQESERVVSKIPIIGENGSVVRLVGISHDITALAASERLLKQQSELLKQILDTLPQKVFVKDRFGVFRMCNRSFAQHHGYLDPNDVVGKTDYSHWPPDRAKEYRDRDQRIIATNTPEVRFLEHQVRGDRRTTLETTKIPLHNPVTGEADGVLGIFDNFSPPVSRRRLKEQSLVYLAMLTRAAGDSKRQGYLLLLGLTHVDGVEFNRATLWRYDPDLKILSGVLGIGPPSRAEASRSRADVGGIGIEECILNFDRTDGAQDEDLAKAIVFPIEFDRLSRISQFIDECTRDDRCDWTIIDPVDSSIDATVGNFLLAIEARETLLVVIPIRGAQTLIVFCDNVRSGAPLLNEETRELLPKFSGSAKVAIEDARTVEERRRQQAGEQAWQEVAWQVSHELFNCLPTAKGPLDAILAAECEDAIKAEARACMKDVSQSIDLVKKFRDYSAATRFDPRDRLTVEQLLHEWVEASREVSMELSVSDVVSNHTILVDLASLVVVWKEMARNSVRAGARSARLGADLASAVDRLGQGLWTPNCLRADLTDDGRGIDARHSDQIFKPCVSFGPNRGTGFGLANARRTLLRHEGRLQLARPVSGVGAHFVFYLPLQ